MAKHALSMLKKRARDHKTKSAAFMDFMDAIAKAHQDALHLRKPKPPTRPFIEEYNHINSTNIHPTTVYQHLNHPNTDTKELSAAKCQLLSAAEEATLLAHIHEMAAHALPVMTCTSGSRSRMQQNPTGDNWVSSMHESRGGAGWIMVLGMTRLYKPVLALRTSQSL